MKFNDFSEKLNSILIEYKQDTGNDMETIDELKKYILKRKFKMNNRRHLTSLKGFGI